MVEWGFLVAVLAVTGGAVAQRVTGMGFALLAVPFLVLAQGPIEGVVLANWCGVLTSAVNLISTRRDVDWHRVRWLTPAAVIGCLPGLLLIRVGSTAVLGLGVGLITLIALLASLRAPEGGRADTRTLRSGIGFASGFMGVSAGVAGPPLVIYRKAVDWPLRRFAASIQFHFMITGLTALLVKWGAGPAYTGWQWLGLIAGLAVGTLIGARLSGRVHPRTGLRLVMIIAFAGTISTIVRALLGLAN